MVVISSKIMVVFIFRLISLDCVTFFYIFRSILDNDHSLKDDPKMVNGNVSMTSVIYANNNTWEENWLFQKKRIKTSQSVPVPMLIPNSNTEYRALIGDRDADDTTDLSDVGSETEEVPSDIKHVLINSKTIIGGKNPDILMALVDQDDSPNDLVKDDDEENNKIDLRTDIESDDVKLNDDNEKNSLNSNVFEENNNIMPVNREEEEENSSNVIQFRDKEPPRRKISQNSRSALKSFLKSLESDNEGDFGVVEPYYGRSPSMLEEGVFSTRDVTEATNLDVIDNKGEQIAPTMLKIVIHSTKRVYSFFIR